MSITKKKTKTPAKKNAKSAAKKATSRIAKKAAKSPAKKKAPGAVGKKTKSPVRKQVATQVNKKTKSAARKQATTPVNKKTKSPVRKQAATPVNKKTKSAAEVVAIPEEIKHSEELHSTPVYNEMNPDRIEENKKSEHQFERREDVVMHQENQKAKSAMANRQGANRVYRTKRHS